MLALKNPAEAYRRVEFDARVSGADPRQLVTMCYEQLIAALGSAVFAHERGDNRMKSQAMTRAISAITALQLGVSGTGGMADVLHQMYESTRRALLNNVLSFDPQMIGTVRQDYIDIARALGQAAH